MSVWSDVTLQSRISSVVDPANPDQVDTSGYRLRVGCETFITGQDASNRHKPYNLSEGDRISIPPGQFALIQTLERVMIPQEAFGLISMRAGAKFDGLINVSGFHVDPGFEGKLIFSVFNSGPKTISLSHGQDIFMIWFLNLDQPNSAGYSNKNTDYIPSDFINKLNMEVNSLPEISKKVNSLINFRRSVLYSAIPIVGMLLTAFVAWYIPWSDRVIQLTADSSFLTTELQRQDELRAQSVDLVSMEERYDDLIAELNELQSAQDQNRARLDQIEVSLPELD